MYREIKGSLIRQKRGTRTLREVAAAANGEFSDVSLMAWEKENWKPTQKNLKHLLNALECSYEEISAPVELDLNN